MARKRRYHIPGAFYHIMLRGNNGQNIFFGDADRLRMCLFIQEGVERYGHRIHAFCYMSNHIHLLIQSSKVPLSKIMHNLAFRYSQYINKRHKKTGHLFQDRFKSILLDESGYFLKLLRYIHMNPVRAALVKAPEDYEWSGHDAYLGKAHFGWLTMEYGLSKFSNNLGEARAFYSAFVLKKSSEEELAELRQRFKDGQILGDDHFVENIRDLHEQKKNNSVSLSLIVDTACAVFDMDKTLLASVSQSRKLSTLRGAIIMCAYEKGITIAEIASLFNRDASSVSKLNSRFTSRCRASNELQVQVNLIRIRTSQLSECPA